MTQIIHRSLFILILTFIAIIQTACRSAEMKLSEKEKAFSQLLSDKYHCEITMSHDRRAVSENEENGIFNIALNNSQSNICAADSLTLIKIAQEVTAGLKDILSNRQHYAAISVTFATMKSTGKNSGEIECDKTVLIDIDDLHSINFTSYFERR